MLFIIKSALQILNSINNKTNKHAHAIPAVLVPPEPSLFVVFLLRREEKRREEGRGAAPQHEANHIPDQKAAAIADVTKESVKRLNVNVLEPVMKQFKAKAILKGKKM